jgi:HK97 family phage major capsid protein
MFNLKFVKMTNDLTPEQVVEKINTLFTEKTAGMPTHDDVSALKSEIEILKGMEKKSADMELALAKFEGKLEAMSEKAITPAPERLGSIGEQVTKGYMSQIDALKGGKTINLETKVTTITADYTGNIALSTLEAGVSHIARQVLKLRNFMNVGRTTSKFVTYIQEVQDGAYGGAGMVAEGGAKPEIEPKYAEVSKEVVKIAGFIKVSKEMLEDLAFVQNEINYQLMQSVEQLMENQLLNGNGTAPNLSGILTNATTFSAGTFAVSIQSPNLADVIQCAVAQIQLAKCEATHIVLNPQDYAKLAMTKGTTGEYTYGSFVVSAPTGALSLCGLPIITSTYMTAGNFLVGDMTKAHLRMREDMNIQVGYVNDDFTKNLVTILCEARAVSFIKANDAPAFVKGVIATCITAITKP